MKKTFTFLSTRAAMMLLATLLLTLIAQTAWADEDDHDWPEYITDIILVGGTESEANAAKTAHSDYTFINVNLNSSAGGDYIYLGYKKSKYANVNGGYITALYLTTRSAGDCYDNLTFDGVEYTRTPCYGGNHFVNEVKGDLNSNAGGEDIHLYYTKHNFYDDKRVISDITIWAGKDRDHSTPGGYTKLGFNGGTSEFDLNDDAGGDYVYMYYKSRVKSNRPTVDPVMATGLVYTGESQQLIISPATLPDGTMEYAVDDSNDYWSQSYNAQELKKTNAGQYRVMCRAHSNQYSNASVTKYFYVTIDKAPNDGVVLTCTAVAEGETPSPQLTNNLSTGAVTYTYSTTKDGTYSSSVPTALGTYWVKATIAGDDNHLAYTTAPISFRIISDWATKHSGTDAANAYVISTTDDLDLLATRVNGGTPYHGKFFKLANNITYSHTTNWDNATSTENNFTAIGNNSHKFNGTFDGNGKTISGIRIYRGDNSYQGIFGKINSSANIHDLTIADTRIIGYDDCGGIVGYNNSGTITNCHVTATVCIHAGKGTAFSHGGIVGLNSGTTRGCTSAATLTIANGLTNCQKYGAIAGDNSGTMTDNLAIGATVPTANENKYGAICGVNTGTLTNNYYIKCTVAGVANATNVGCNNADVTENNGAVPGIILCGNSSNTDINSYILTTVGNAAVPSLVLSDRTLYKDGDWNTLCLPFAVTIAGSPLAGDNVVAKVLNTSSKLENGTLTLNFSDAPATIPAGTPFIIKWDNTGVNLTENDLVFTGVTIDNTNRDVAFTDGQFKGNYAPLEITDANRNSIVLLAAGNKLGYAKTDRTIANGKALGAFRAYFNIPANANAPAINSYELNFGEDSDENTTGIIEVNTNNTNLTNKAEGVFDLQGRKVANPSKGLYIVNGRKVIIK